MTNISLDFADIAARRSSTWWLLSRLVTEAPQDPWLAELESALGGIDADAQEPLGLESEVLRAALRDARAATEGMTALAVDRTRLLAAVFQKDSLPAPHESAALGEPMNSDRVLGLVESYQEAGFDNPAPELGPPDHLGTELRFMALLCFRESMAYRGADAGEAPAWLDRQRRFLDDHLLAWVPEHCMRIAAHAGTPFYAAIASLVARACQVDRRDLAELIAMQAASVDPAVALVP